MDPSSRRRTFTTVTKSRGFTNGSGAGLDAHTTFVSSSNNSRSRPSKNHLIRREGGAKEADRRGEDAGPGRAKGTRRSGMTCCCGVGRATPLEVVARGLIFVFFFWHETKKDTVVEKSRADGRKVGDKSARTMTGSHALMGVVLGATSRVVDRPQVVQRPYRPPNTAPQQTDAPEVCQQKAYRGTEHQHPHFQAKYTSLVPGFRALNSLVVLPDSLRGLEEFRDRFGGNLHGAPRSDARELAVAHQKIKHENNTGKTKIVCPFCRLWRRFYPFRYMLAD